MRFRRIVIASLALALVAIAVHPASGEGCSDLRGVWLATAFRGDPPVEIEGFGMAVIYRERVGILTQTRFAIGFSEIDLPVGKIIVGELDYSVSEGSFITIAGMKLTLEIESEVGCVELKILVSSKIMEGDMYFELKRVS